MSDVQVFKPMVRVNNKPLSSSDLQTITEIVVHQEVCVPGMFSIEFMAQSVQHKSWDYLNFDHFNLGDKVEIQMNQSQLIIGEIYSLEPKFDKNGGKVVIRGHDYLNRLKLGKKTNVYNDKKDSEIVEEIARSNRISCSVEDSKSKHENVIQHALTDYQFLLGRMELTGFIVYVRDEELHYKKADLSATAVADVEFPRDIRDGEIYMAISQEYGDHQYGGWDEMKKESISSKKSATESPVSMGQEKSSFQRFSGGFGDRKNHFFNPEMVDQQMADEFVSGRFFRNSLNTVKGKLSISGNPELRISDNINLKGFGKFAGKYFISEVKQTFYQNNLETDLSVLRVGI
ncbi:MAG: phage late control D family protein [Bdellovibrionales bacterium]